MKIIGSKQKWDRKITIELTLKEFQMIYDSIGVTSFDDVISSYKDKSEQIPYGSDTFYDFYDELEEEIANEGGIVLD